MKKTKSLAIGISSMVLLAVLAFGGNTFIINWGGNVTRPQQSDSTTTIHVYGVVEKENQIFHEAVGIAGTPFGLHYTSWRVPGNVTAYTLEIPILEDNPPDDIKTIDVGISVANTQVEFEPERIPGSVIRYIWDGRDNTGQPVEDGWPTTVTVQYNMETMAWSLPSHTAPIGTVAGQGIITGCDPTVAGVGFNTDDDSNGDGTDIDGGNFVVDEPDYNQIVLTYNPVMLSNGSTPGNAYQQWLAGVQAYIDDMNTPISSYNMTASETEIIYHNDGCGHQVDQDPLKFSRTYNCNLGVLMATKQSLGGWTITPHHRYDIRANELYLGNGTHYQAFCLNPPEVSIVSKSGSQLYRFDQNGRHLATVSTLTGVTNLQFKYDAADRLIQIVDIFTNTVTIERDASGTPTAIVANNGQRTELTLDANGYINTVVNPAGETNCFSYTTNGLLTQVTGRRGGVYTFDYDDQGRTTLAQDPAGGFDTFEYTNCFSGFAVTNSYCGYTSEYKITYLDDGGQKRETFVPGIAVTNSHISDALDISNTSVFSDGTSYNTQKGPDPRFDMLAPQLEQLNINLPSGLHAGATIERAVSLTDSNDPMSLIALTNTITINNNTYITEYNAVDKTYTITTPENRSSGMEFNDIGQPTKLNIPGLYAIEAQYDNQGRLITISQGTGTAARVTHAGYSDDGYLYCITNALGQTIQLDRDVIGRVTNLVRADQETIQMNFDASSNVKGITPPDSQEHTFDYSVVNLMEEYTPPDVGPGDESSTYTYSIARQSTGATLPGNTPITNSFDSMGRLSTVIWPENKVQLTYSPTNGHLTNIADTNGNQLSLLYDGMLLNIIDIEGDVTGKLTCAYNNNLMPRELEINESISLDYTYDNDALLTNAGIMQINRQADNGFMTNTILGDVNDNRQYNPFGETDEYNVNAGGDNIYQAIYYYDILGRISGLTEGIFLGAIHYDYTYDEAGRLIAVTNTTGGYSHYQYDANGNRTNANINGITSTATYDAQDRMLTYGAGTYQYTLAGSLTNKTVGGQSTAYDYDAMGNLLKVSLPDTTEITYSIDAVGRRIGKKVNGTVQRKYVYLDQINPVAEYDASGGMVAYYVYATRGHVPDYMVRSGETYRIISDHLGSVRMVVNTADSTVAQRMDFDEFGNVLTDTNPGFQPFGFAGGLYDPDTQLTRFGYRDYDPETGRWQAKDPILFKGGQANLYVYCYNCPNMFIDPFGLYNWNNPGGHALGRQIQNWQNYISSIIGDAFSGPSFDVGIGFAVHGSSVNPATSGGGGVIGFNSMAFFGDDGATSSDYAFGTDGRGNFGLDIGVAMESVWAIGEGPWSGDFNAIASAFGPFAASIFWSPGPGGWIGFTYGIGVGLPGIAYEETTYYEIEDGDLK